MAFCLVGLHWIWIWLKMGRNEEGGMIWGLMHITISFTPQRLQTPNEKKIKEEKTKEIFT